jgi:hypothetical protein
MQDKTYLNRGSAMDAAYRLGLSGAMPTAWRLESQDEIEKVQWAIRETLELADGSPVISDKDKCKVWIPGFHNPGEVDSKCPDKLFSIDVKSGQEYDYYYQQVHYGRGEMEEYFADEWTIFMLYFDLCKKVKYSFTLEEAARVSDEETARFYDPGEPRINPYCAWCDNFTSCPAQLALVDRAMGHMRPEFNFEEIKKDPVKLGEFLTVCYPVCKNEGFYDQGKKEAKEQIFKKVQIPGWGLQSRKGNKYVEVKDIPSSMMSKSDLLPDTIGEKEYLEFCDKHSIVPDQKLIKQGAGSTFLVQKTNHKDSTE